MSFSDKRFVIIKMPFFSFVHDRVYFTNNRFINECNVMAYDFNTADISNPSKISNTKNIDKEHDKKAVHNGKYNPKYDPWFDKTPGQGQQYAPTFWLADAGKPPEDDGQLTQDIEADVAIIGSGFTGLSTAIHLAKEHGIKAVVLEANHVSFGCSSRNGGQAQCASGRLKRSQWISTYGKEQAFNIHDELIDAMENFKDLIQDIDCDAEAGGHFYIAHKASAVKDLKKEIDVHNKVFGYKSTFVDAETLRSKFVNDHEAHGAMLEPEGISIQPAKLAFGYLKKARALGVKVYTSSPVNDWVTSDQGKHTLITPMGNVKADKVVIATGGYTSNHLHPSMKNKIMPILSNNMVTRELTDDEIEQVGIQTGIPLTDTRVLRNYYRLLPSKRLQIGSRSALSGQAAPNIKYQKMLEENMYRKFPVLHGVDIEYSWWGWVDVSHDMMPRIVSSDNKSVFYAAGYGGNGVMYSAQAGKRVAQLVADQSLPRGVPFFESELPYPIAFKNFESQLFAPFRRLGQQALYHWYWLKDENNR